MIYLNIIIISKVDGENFEIIFSINNNFHIYLSHDFIETKKG